MDDRAAAVSFAPHPQPTTLQPTMDPSVLSARLSIITGSLKWSSIVNEVKHQTWYVVNNLIQLQGALESLLK